MTCPLCNLDCAHPCEASRAGGMCVVGTVMKAKAVDVLQVVQVEDKAAGGAGAVVEVMEQMPLFQEVA